jgi:hypothetical protein
MAEKWGMDGDYIPGIDDGEAPAGSERLQEERSH